MPGSCHYKAVIQSCYLPKEISTQDENGTMSR